MLCLVYHEAKKNVLSGRYPLTLDECDNLAGLQVLITDKEQQQATSVLEPLEDSLEYFRCVSSLFSALDFIAQRQISRDGWSELM